MEERKPFMPPPPRELRKDDLPLKTSTFDESEKKIVSKETFAEQASRQFSGFDLSSQVRPFEQKENDKIENSLPETKASEKKKFSFQVVNWNAVINWAGLVISVVSFVLFLYLLLK